MFLTISSIYNVNLKIKYFVKKKMIFLSKYDKIKNDSFNQITLFNKILKKWKIWSIGDELLP